MPLQIVQQNIVHMKTDAIVNAANSGLQAGGGVCGAIFNAAGHERLQSACSKIGHCDTGSAVITPGFGLAAKYIIHAVGPVWRGGEYGEEKQLLSCYTAALELANEHGLESIAVPLISSGIYGYPTAEAFHVAVSAIRDFLSAKDMDVFLVVYDRNAFRISEKLFASIKSYIYGFLWPPVLTYAVLGHIAATIIPRKLEAVLENIDESFSESLFRIINQKGYTDVEVYKRANIDRKLFSKIRRPDYKPGKRTAVALCIALKLDIEQTAALMAKAGYALSTSNRFDLIVRYFIENGCFDVFTINEALFAFDQQLLGA